MMKLTIFFAEKIDFAIEKFTKKNYCEYYKYYKKKSVNRNTSK